MSEDSSGNDSMPVLWGEINSKPQPSNVESLWRPISAYQISKEERSSNIQSCSDSAFTSEMKKILLYSDPVGQHLIKLRHCYYKLTVLLNKAQMPRKNSSVINQIQPTYDEQLPEDAENHRRKKAKCEEAKFYLFPIPKLPPFPGAFLPPPPSIPEFPENYPVSGSSKALCKNKHKVMTCFLQKDQVEELIRQFVQQVIVHSGYYDSDPAAIECLINATEKFLTRFTCDLKHEKDSDVFSESGDLLGPLETALQRINFGGIHSLHKFYIKFIDKHDTLLRKCENMLERYEKLRKTNIKQV